MGIAHLWRVLSIVLVSVVVVSSLAGPVSAGGSWFTPVKDRYEPGDEATLVGYTGGGAYGWVEDGPFFGFLVDANENGEMAIDGQRRPLGQIELVDTGALGYLRLRASITFSVPPELEPGVYHFDYCNADCTERLGDLIGGTIHVGVDPSYPVSREWPLDDPEVANLDDSARLSGPGFDVSAGEIRDGSAVGAAAVMARSMQSTGTTSPTSPPDAEAATSSAPEEVVVGPEPSKTNDEAAFDESGDSTPWAYGGLVALAVVGLGAAVGERSRSKGLDRVRSGTAGSRAAADE